LQPIEYRLQIAVRGFIVQLDVAVIEQLLALRDRVGYGLPARVDRLVAERDVL
jgi:hypothetical protein